MFWWCKMLWLWQGFVCTSDSSDIRSGPPYVICPYGHSSRCVPSAVFLRDTIRGRQRGCSGNSLLLKSLFSWMLAFLSQGRRNMHLSLRNVINLPLKSVQSQGCVQIYQTNGYAFKEICGEKEHTVSIPLSQITIPRRDQASFPSACMSTKSYMTLQSLRPVYCYWHE